MEIDLYSRLQDPIAAIDKMGEWFTRSGMFKCTRVEGGKMLALICVAEKKSPIEVHREYHIMENGTITPKARNVHAKFLARGGKIKWLREGEEDIEYDKLDAAAEFTFGEQVKTIAFSITKARQQGLDVDNPKSTWRKNPGAMLRARLITKAVDLFCPDILMGGEDPAEEYQEPAKSPRIDLSTTAATAPAGATITVNADPVPATAPASAEPARVIDAQVLPADPPKPAAPTPTSPATAGEGLPADVVAEVEKVISSKGPEFRARCLAWMVGNGKLLPGQEINALPSSMGSQIMNRGAAFLRAVESYKVAA